MNFRLLVIGFVIYKDYFIVLKRLKGIVEFNYAVTVIIFYLLCDPLLGKSLPVRGREKLCRKIKGTIRT